MQGKRSLRMEGLYGKRNMLTDKDRVKGQPVRLLTYFEQHEQLERNEQYDKM